MARLRVAAGGLSERLQAGAAQAAATLAAARAAAAAAAAAQQARAAAAQPAPAAPARDANSPPMEPLPDGVPSLRLLTPPGGRSRGSTDADTFAAAPPSPLPPPPAPPARDPAARSAAFAAALAPPRADLEALRALTLAGGVPESVPGLRLTVWQLLLGALPPDVASWRSARAQQRASYARLVRELVVAAPRDAAAAAAAAAADDHPLAQGAASAWARHFAHAETREQIARDVERTQRDMHFFSGCPQAAAHRDACARALFVYAATNATVRYVQGMNELMAPLFYVAATSAPADGDDDGDQDDASDAVAAGVSPAEAAAFACFVPLLAELRDLFCAGLDGSAGGVAGTLAALSGTLKRADPALYRHLERRCGVHPQFYAFRWITTALTQEFPLPDALRAWDALLADGAGPRVALTRAAAAMVLHLRPQLLAGDFAANLKLLQAFPPADGARGRTGGWWWRVR
jgi:hypothetical protein